MSEPERIGSPADALPFDARALALELARHLPGDWAALRLRPFLGGQSNPTYLLEAGAARYVLRKQPPGVLLPSAHAVDREARIMRALAATDVPVARVLHEVRERELIGTPFYVTEYCAGRVFKDPLLPGMTPEQRAAIHDSMNLTLARIHKVDVEAHGLADYGRAGNYFQRQIDRWSRQYRDSETGTVAAMDALMARLPPMVPTDERSAIAHGDFRIENLIYHPERPEVIAVVDWELSTLGHPLADLAYNCFAYHLPHRAFMGLADADLRGSGVPDEQSYVARYVERTGIVPAAPWGFYVGFALFRLAAILQGVKKRALSGQASSPDALERGSFVELCATAGLRALGDA